MNIEKRRAEIAARKAEIRKLIEGDSENKLNMDDLEKELRELNEEDEKLEKRQAIERMLNGGAAPASPAAFNNPVARSANQPAPENSDVLYRSAWLKTLQGKPLTDDEKRAYSTASGSGLPIIPETTANQIIKKMYEVAPILQRCKIFHVPGNFKFAIEGTNDEAALHTENAAITAASDSLGSVSLTGYEIVKLVKASRACSEMALSAFESYIVEVIAEAVARRIEKYIFTGTGTNQPGGVKTAGKGASGAYTDGTDQITVGKTASLTEENVIALYGLLGDGYERNAVWSMNKATFFSDFFPLMNKSKNNVIEFANGKYYIMGAEVSLPALSPHMRRISATSPISSATIRRILPSSAPSTPASLRTASTISALACSTPSRSRASVHSCISQRRRLNRRARVWQSVTNISPPSAIA